MIRGMEKLKQQISEEQIYQLQQKAERYQADSNINFSIKYADEQVVEITCRQDVNKSGKYATESSLIRRTNEVFGSVLQDFQIVVLPLTFLPSPTTAVTPGWLDQQMQRKGKRIKQVAYDTGLDRETISDWVSGKRSMSQIVKAMFYYYFLR